MKLRWFLYWIIGALPLFLTAALYAFLPEMIPLRYDSSNMVNAWAPKFPTAFLMPLTVLLISCIAALLPCFGDVKLKSPGFYEFCISIFAALLSISFITLILL